MKVVLDTNIYIAWIRERKYPELLLDVRTQKYLPSHVLMELWAGAREKKAARIVEKLQKPYQKTNRINSLTSEQYIRAGQLLALMPVNISNKRKNAGFVNDLFIALSAVAIGAVLFTENKADFEIIRTFLPELKVVYVAG
jgi:predicted nucleic acid-binding protein